MATIDKALPNEVRKSIEIDGPEVSESETVEIQESLPDQGQTEINPTEDGGVEINFEPGAFNQAQSENHYDNLAELLPEEVLEPLGSELTQNYRDYKQSRADWERTYTQGLDLLGFKYDQRTEPFQGASGATHPVLAEAVTQFQALAYKELLPANGPVRTQVIGVPSKEKEEQSQRVKDFMNYQIMDVMEEYEPEFDQMLFYLPLSGSSFKKVYYDDLLGRAVSKFVPAEDLVVPYAATSLEDAEAIVHLVKMGENDLRKQQVAGFYRDIEIKPGYDPESDLSKKEHELEGLTRGRDPEVFTLLECHVNLDLEGFEDRGPEGEMTGIKLPYIVGGLSRTATAALRQLLDAGTLANLPAGFKQRGIRVQNDVQAIQPGEFRDVDAPGGSIKDAFMMLPFKEPSQTLLQLMGVVVSAGQRFASIADLNIGDGNQQAAVGTTVALLERGSRTMSAIHKRLYASLKNEFKLLTKVFKTYLPQEYPYDVVGGQRQIKVADFDDKIDVVPVADPNIFSQTQRISMAQTELQLAQSNPQMHNLYEAYRSMYEAIGVKNIDLILKPPVKPVPKDPAVEHIDAITGQKFQAFPGQDHRAHMTAHLAFMGTNMARNNPQIQAMLEKNIFEHISLMALEQIEMEFQKEIVEMQQMAQNPQMMQNPQTKQMMQQMSLKIESRKAVLIAEMMEEYLKEQKEILGDFSNDPIAQLRARELDLRAADNARKEEEGQERLNLDKMRAMMNQQNQENKLEQNEDLAELRAATSLTKQVMSTDSKKHDFGRNFKKN